MKKGPIASGSMVALLLALAIFVLLFEKGDMRLPVVCAMTMTGLLLLAAQRLVGRLVEIRDALRSQR